MLRNQHRAVLPEQFTAILQSNQLYTSTIEQTERNSVNSGFKVIYGREQNHTITLDLSQATLSDLPTTHTQFKGVFRNYLNISGGYFGASSRKHKVDVLI